MAQSIAFATTKSRSEDMESLATAGRNVSIDVLHSIHRGDELVIPGIDNFLRHQSGDWDVSWLCDSHSSDIASAFHIHRELSEFQGDNKEPRLIEFLKELDNLGFPAAEAWFFGATEWQASDEVLTIGGYVGELANYLAAVGTTSIWLWSPETMRVQESDRYPFAFRLVKRSNRADEPFNLSQ